MASSTPSRLVLRRLLERWPVDSAPHRFPEAKGPGHWKNSRSYRCLNPAVITGYDTLRWSSYFFEWLSWKSQLAKADETFKFVLLLATPACSFEPQQWAYKGRSQEQKHHSWPTSPLACHGDLQMDQQRKPPNPKMHPTVVCGQRLYRVFVQFACCSWVKDFLKCQAGSCSKRMA